MSFQTVKKDLNRTKMLDPGHVYIPSAIRELLVIKPGDDLEILVNQEDEEILIRKFPS